MNPAYTGDVLVVGPATGRLPAPTAGFSAPRHANVRDKYATASGGKGFSGVIPDCDFTHFLFLRVGTKVVVTDSERFAGEEWCALVVKSGPYSGQVAWLPRSAVGKWEKPKGFDETKWTQKARSEMVWQYFASLEKAIRHAGGVVGGPADPTFRYVADHNRDKFEKIAAEAFALDFAQMCEANKLAEAELRNLILAELAAGGPVAFTDR